MGFKAEWDKAGITGEMTKSLKWRFEAKPDPDKPDAKPRKVSGSTLSSHVRSATRAAVAQPIEEGEGEAKKSRKPTAQEVFDQVLTATKGVPLDYETPDAEGEEE